MARRRRPTSAAEAPLQKYPTAYKCLFEVRLHVAKEGGMAVSAVRRLIHLLAF
jgi:hypothetical protein